MNNSKQYYDKLAIEYRAISDDRIEYLNSIDDIVVQRSIGSKSYLDIGAGDGRRSIKIADSIGLKNITLIDNSTRIIQEISQNKNVELFIGTIEEYNSERKFELITCLWNVLGHVGVEEDRISFFKSVKRLLSQNGKCIIDVNNRYNISHYGLQNVMMNIKKDIWNASDSGYFKLYYAGVSTIVYIHAPFELEKLLKSIGLNVSEVLYIDYKTGEERQSCFEGQLVYVIENS